MQPAHQPLKRLPIHKSWQDEGKFITTEPHDHVIGAQRRLETNGDFLEEGITGIMAKRVIDHLEIVEVGNHQCACVATTLSACKGPLQPVHKYGTIIESSEWITLRLLLDDQFCPLEIGYVRADTHRIAGFGASLAHLQPAIVA